MGSLLPGDIKQGSLGNCWFVASLTGLANVPDGIQRICVEYDTSELPPLLKFWLATILDIRNYIVVTNVLSPLL